MKLIQNDVMLIFTYKSFPLVLYRRNIFYLRPLQKVPSEPWFTDTPIGKNTLGNMMEQMCQKAKVSQNYTNHSLRAFAATKLHVFQAGVSQKLIQQHTGH